MRLNDRQLRTTFFLLQKTTRENEESTERVEQLEEARGFDRELMMAMTFHEVRNPLNGTVGHLRLAKQLLSEMRRDAALPAEMRRDTGGGGEGGGGGGEGGGEGGGGGDGGQYCTTGSGSGSTLGALAEEVDESIVSTELAVQYLGTLATLHGALTGSRELVLAPTELTELVRSAASSPNPHPPLGPTATPSPDPHARPAPHPDTSAQPLTRCARPRRSCGRSCSPAWSCAWRCPRTRRT